MIIIRDTREKVDFFTFGSYSDVTVVDKKLDVGDYTVKGYENKITIDRKRNSGEILLNLGAQAVRIQKELDRMAKLDQSYFVCSFPYTCLNEFPEGSGIPKYRWKYLKAKGSFMRKRIHEIEETYVNISFIFCDNNMIAEETTYNLLKGYVEENTNGR